MSIIPMDAIFPASLDFFDNIVEKNRERVSLLHKIHEKMKISIRTVELLIRSHSGARYSIAYPVK